MSLYILPENQTLIWNTISKVSNFQKKEQKQQWFRNIIQSFYDNSNHNIGVQELRSLNKETIQYMIKDLKHNSDSVSYRGFSSNNFFQNNSLEANTMESRDYLMEQKKGEINNKFEGRQQEYGSMLQRPKVEAIDFSEKKQDDIPLENIDNLLQKQMKEREYDIQPLQTKTPKVESIEPVKSDSNVSLDIQNLDENEKLPKQVSWTEDVEKQYASKEQFFELEKQMQDFRKFVSDEIFLLKEEISELKQQIQRKHIEEESTEKMKNIMTTIKGLEKTKYSKPLHDKSVLLSE